MHKFMRTIGFGSCEDKEQLERLLKRLAKEASVSCSLEEGNSGRLCELRAETAPGMGVVLVGRLTPSGIFRREYYFPYVESPDITSTAECSIQRHAERETYAGLLDEYRVGISLIFYLENSLEYRIRRRNLASTAVDGVVLTGLSVQGKILLPIQKTPQQAESLKQEAKKRTSLLEAAKRGDEDAIETLTVEDIDLYSTVTKRIAREDVYSIIETCFMPCGVECDQYSVIGIIQEVTTKTNRLTKEEVYVLRLECNDMYFSVAIRKKDLLGEPLPGRRFKGQVWMQGHALFSKTS